MTRHTDNALIDAALRDLDSGQVADLSAVLAPDYVARARELATKITEPAKSAAAAADRLEDFARKGRVAR